jgi:DNA-binding response OmpR family regulator
MIWQLLACLLLFCVLVFCIIFQLKTILLQKQIDRIRHEFMKNMIYEMKQPQPSDIEGIMQRIGHTEFYYSLNELRFENQRIIITSRQAEILRILSENQCKSISREYILKEVWGDDSFSNSKALNVQISYLRRALISDHTISIEPIIRKGYMLKIDK